MDENIKRAESLDDLMDTVDEKTLRKDLVYSLLIKAWDIGYCEGCEDVREGMREWAKDY
jgi:hypothetical protein